MNALVAEIVKLLAEGTVQVWEYRVEMPPMPWVSDKVSRDHNPEPGLSIKQANHSTVEWSKLL